MPSRTSNRRKLPGRQAATARAVLRGSAADLGEQERLGALPPWARLRIVELETELERLTKLAKAVFDHLPPIIEAHNATGVDHTADSVSSIG